MGGETRSKKILVRAPNWIGDAVMCLPAIEALKALYADSSITVLTKTRALPVFEGNPHVTGLMEYDSHGRHRGVKGRLRLAGEIRRRAFSTAVLFQNAFDAAFLAFTAGIPERVGYARDMRKRLLTKAIPLTGEAEGVHQVYYYLNVVKELGGEVPESPTPRVYVTEAEHARAEEFLKENGAGGTLIVGAAPGASYGPAKRWAPERFAEVLNRIARDFNALPVICGGPDDRPACGETAKRLNCRHLDLAGEVSLREFIALLPHMGLFITNDSGPMHLSAASGVPTVAVFGSTDPTATGPLGPKTEVVRREVPCAPCFERECSYGHYDCLAFVTPDDVYSAAAIFLEKEVQRGL